MANQFLHATLSPEVALYYAEAFGNDSKHQIVEIDLQSFNGEIIDVSDAKGCNRHGVKHGTKAYNFAVKHEVVLLAGYANPALLSEPFDTSAANHQTYRRGSSFADFASGLPYHVRNELNNWRRGSKAATRGKPQPRTSPTESVSNDDALQGSALRLATEKLAKDIANLEARKGLLDSMSKQLQNRIEQEARKKEEERQRKLEEEKRERQRQEELKRKREEEQRQEESWREEQRRKHAKWQAEENRGPKIWASCNVQEDLYEDFDRSTLHVALGNGGYIMLWDWVKGHAWSGIPKDLSDKLNGRGYHQSHATLAALSPDSSNYFVQFSDGRSQWRGPEGFTEAVQQYSARPAVVAFGPHDSWFVKWDDGCWQHEGLPRSLQNMLDSNRHRAVGFLSMSGIDDDDYIHSDIDDAAWFIRWEDGNGPAWKLTGSPTSLSEAIEEIQEWGGSVRSVEFGSHGEWVLRYAD